MQDAAPLTALAFSANGHGLVTANASNHIGVYNVESLSASDWTRKQGSHLPARLLKMPGSIAQISVHPQVRILIIIMITIVVVIVIVIVIVIVKVIVSVIIIMMIII